MKEAAAKYGEGVVFVSSKPIKTADRVGRVATYQFADIRTLRIDQKPQTGDMPGASSSKGTRKTCSSDSTSSPPAPRSSPSSFPKPSSKRHARTRRPSKDGKKKSLEPGQLEMMKKLFDGLKVAIDVDVLGTIVKTNSPYVQGSRVTLLEMDFSQLLANEALLAADRRARLDRGSQADAQEREGVQGEPRSRGDDRVQVESRMTRQPQRHGDTETHRAFTARSRKIAPCVSCLCVSVIDIELLHRASLTKSIFTSTSWRTLMSSTSRPSACTRNRLATTALTSPLTSRAVFHFSQPGSVPTFVDFS